MIKNENKKIDLLISLSPGTPRLSLLSFMNASAVDVNVWGDSVRSGPLSLSKSSKLLFPVITNVFPRVQYFFCISQFKMENLNVELFT